MRKIIKSFFCFILFLCLLPHSLPVFADEVEQAEEVPENLLHIGSVEALFEFAENCRLDSYSIDLTVTLDTDIDLTGTSFSAIPIFGGIFEGNGHSITGISITEDGSTQGFFRYLQPAAIVRNLNIEGAVTPSGSKNAVGGIAGSNAGLIENCSFTGTVTGADKVGGIAGINQLTGIIEGCTTDGTITGNHFTGGIAGENPGVIRSCTNNAEINTTAAQNNVNFSDITLETLTGSESADTATDVGGIAGASSGVVRNCTNRGNVGYQHMGYNIGGILGTQSGYITGCTNYGKIFGRKETGGIVGQMEPAVRIEYTADTLQILQGQLDTLENLTNQTSSNAQTGVSDLSDQLPALQEQIDAAGNAIDILRPDYGNPFLPDADTLLAAQNSLASSLSAMPDTLNHIAVSAQNTADTISSDMRAIASQINAISNTIGSASDHIGGSVTDISDLDTEEDLTGKVEDCANHGAVLSDLNGGGITGAISFENDLDPDDDVEIAGDISLNFSGEVRAVILRCENTGTVSVKNQNGGGIVGRQYLGLVKGCINAGNVDGEEADHLGGIAGRSNGYIRSCDVRCALTGDAWIGGIAGTGDTVTGCRSMVSLAGRERLGSILGYAGDTENVLGNYYMIVGTDQGAVDGISYAGIAEPLAQAEFLSMEDLPEMFGQVTVLFLFDDGRTQTVTLAPNEELRDADIPSLEERDGYVAVWEGLAETDRSRISFDMTFEAVYSPLRTVIESSERGENGLGILLAQGVFAENAEIILTELTQAAPVEEGCTFLEGREFEITSGNAVSLRYLPAGEYDTNKLSVMLRNADGLWYTSEVTADGSYLVFDIAVGDTAFCLAKKPAGYAVLWAVAGGVGIVAAAVCVVILRRRRYQKK